VTPVQSDEEMLESEHAWLLRYVEPGDRMPAISLPVNVDGERLTVAGVAPEQCEQTAEVRAAAAADASNPQ
jgi:hypothetical protein